MATKRRFELSEGSSDKFWEVEVDGKSMTVTFGRQGTAGQSKTKAFGTVAEAQREADKLVTEKTKKGYAETGGKPTKAAKGSAKETTPEPAAKAATKKKATADAAPVANEPNARSGPSPKAIQELLETLAAKEKKLAKQLQKPATPSALAILRGLGAPASMVALYAAHDGSEAELMGPYQLLPVAEIESERAMMNELLAKSTAWQKDGTWSTRWIPFMADGDGQYYAIDPDGSCNEGAPGQVIFYDHEVGADREFQSFDVFVGLLTSLAKKKLLGMEAQEENEEKIDALKAEAKAVGLPKMSPKELKAVLAELEGDDDDTPSAEARLALLMPLVKKYGAEEKLWSEVRDAASELERWPLVIEAAETAMRIAPKSTKSWQVPKLVLAYHRTGRDADALAVLKKGVGWESNINAGRVSLIPEGVTPAFRAECLRLITEIYPIDQNAWIALGEESTDPKVRTQAFTKVIEIIDGMSYQDYFFKGRKVDMQRLVEHERIAPLAPAARLEALTAFAKRIDDGENARLWSDVAALANDLGRWNEADAAGARAIELTDDDGRYKVCDHRLRALHELGREDEALAILRKAVADSYYATLDMCFVAIPWQTQRQAGDLERTAEQKAFEARCFAVVTEVGESNLEAWKWRAKLATGAERVAACEHLVAHWVEEEKGAVDWDEESRDDLARTRKEAERDLEAARAAAKG